jgi:hypothetical protein
MPRRNDLAKIVALLVITVSTRLAFSQTVCGGSAAQCEKRQTRLCKAEKAAPNLNLSSATTVRGTVRDGSGEVISTRYSIEIRDTDGVVIADAVLKAGRFEFPDLEKGSYRMLVLRFVGEKKLRPDLFDQPGESVCGSANECDLNIVLKLHGTDDPLDFCPPK